MIAISMTLTCRECGDRFVYKADDGYMKEYQDYLEEFGMHIEDCFHGV